MALVAIEAPGVVVIALVVLIIGAVFVFALAALGGPRNTGGTPQVAVTEEDQGNIAGIAAYSGSEAGLQIFIQNNSNRLLTNIQSALTKANASGNQDYIDLLEKLEQKIKTFNDPDTTSDLKKQKYNEIKNDFNQLARIFPEVFAIVPGTSGTIVKTAIVYTLSPSLYESCRIQGDRRDCKKFVKAVLEKSANTSLRGLANDVTVDMKNGFYGSKWQYIELQGQVSQLKSGDILLCHRPNTNGHVGVYIGNGVSVEASWSQNPGRRKLPRFVKVVGSTSCPNTKGGLRFQAVARYQE